MSIVENVVAVREVIAESAKISGRDPSEITLIGVTKTIDTTRIKELLTVGVQNIGENRVQEFLPKYEELGAESATWHFIGHLQRNKVKYIVDKVDLIHSLDSLPLAVEIDKCARKIGKIMDVLVEVNVGNEPNKHGVAPNEILDFMGNLVKLTNIRPCGLMCIPPFVKNAEENRPFFEIMRNLNLDIQRTCLYDTNSIQLSYGMSNCFHVAIQEGATMIRLGEALFGSRT